MKAYQKAMKPGKKTLKSERHAGKWLPDYNHYH